MVAILVVLTILTCITIDAFLQWRRARRPEVVFASAAARRGLVKPFVPEQISLPAGVFVDPNHTWIEIHGDGKTRVGLDDFILKAIGRIDEIVLPKVGTQIRRGETLFTLKQGERTIDIPSPVEGVISSVNEMLTSAPELIGASPYRQGWGCTITPTSLAKSLKQLPIAEEALSWIQSEVRRFYDFIAVRPLENVVLGHVLQDGGVITCGVLEFMDDETWKRFADQFVHNPSH